MDTSTTYYGRGYWWLRSPSNGSSNNVDYVSIGGYVNSYSIVSSSVDGVVPALKIQL